MADVFAVQDEIASSVVETLKVKLLGAPNAPLVSRPTDNLEAYNLYLQGRYHVATWTASALDRADRYFQQSLAAAPSYAQAHAGVALVRGIRAGLSFAAPQKLMESAREAALLALALDEKVADAHLGHALVLDYHDGDWDGAEREYRRAIDLNPSDAWARGFYSSLLGRLGRTDASFAESEVAVERDPLSLVNRYCHALALCMARRFDDAIGAARAGIELVQAPVAYWPLRWALVGVGRIEEAVATFRHAVALAPGDPVSLTYLGWVLGVAGNREEAVSIRAELIRRRKESYFASYLMAQLSVGLEEPDEAISYLQQAVEQREPLRSHCQTWAPFDSLRSDPRFQALLRRMNLPEAASSPTAPIA